MQQLDEYDTFKDIGKNAPISSDYKKIRVHLVFAVKHDGRHKARLVADGHLTVPYALAKIRKRRSKRGFEIIVITNLE